MEDLIFYALLIALVYYCFIYLPQQKKALNQLSQPTLISQSTQTEPVVNQDEQDLAKTLDNLIKSIRQLNHQLK